LNGRISAGTRQFLIRRFLRLYPACWLLIPLGFLAYWMLFGLHMDIAVWLANAELWSNVVFGVRPGFEGGGGLAENVACLE
jgi:peptidoglycan/LPS O-acetylase OafA/YrhL